MQSLVTLLLIGRFAPGSRVKVLFTWIILAVGLTDESLRWLRITGPDCTIETVSKKSMPINENLFLVLEYNSATLQLILS